GRTILTTYNFSLRSQNRGNTAWRTAVKEERVSRRMARSAKSALVLCMDVGFSMSNSAPGQEPPFEQAKKVIQKFVQRQVFAENKDELGLVLFGTDSTKNPLSGDGQYQNIFVRRNLMMPDFELLEEIQNDVQPGNQQADWLDALVVCMDLLQKQTLGKKYDRLNIAILTDLCTPVSADQLDTIIANVKRAGITLQFFSLKTAQSGGLDHLRFDPTSDESGNSTS
ncbi:hypothetical protein AAFF_G00211190, partial [Aldrovandia affinis]